MWIVEVVLCLAVFAGINAQDFLPSNFEPCAPADKKCIVFQAQNMVPLFANGIPQIGVKPVDPLPLKKISFNLAGLSMNLTDGVLYDLKTTQIDNVRFDMKKRELEIWYHCDARLVGKYVADGRLIILPIKGNGDFLANLKHLNIQTTAPFEIKKDKDGKEHLHLKTYTFSYSVKGNDNAKFKLSNLFEGNEQFARALEVFIDQNGELLTNELGQPIIDAVLKVLYKQINKLFGSTPLDQLAKI